MSVASDPAGEQWPHEEWRPVVGWEGYEVSNLGRVKSYHQKKPRILKTDTLPTGHLKVRLYNHPRRQDRSVHKLVADAFIGPCPKGMVVRHLDGNPANNVVSNLRVGTYAENTQDMIRHGNCWKLNKNECAQGHPFNEANTMRGKRGHRICRICTRNSDARCRARKALAAANVPELGRDAA